MSLTATHAIAGVEVLVEGEGPETLVMLHGWPDTHHLWDAQVAALQSRYRCVRFTWPGFDVATPRRAYSLDELVDTLAQVVDTLSPGQPVSLMLHDWGCLFGYQYAMRHPSRVARIVGVDVGDASSGRYLRSLSLKAKLMIAAYQGWLALAWRLGGRLGDRMTRSMARALRAPGEPARIGSCMNYPYYIQWMRAHGSYRGLLRFEPACPMLYLYGTRKPFLFHSPQWAQDLAAKPGNRVIALATGHWVMRADAAGFNAAVRSWLDDRSAAPAVVPDNRA